jgi:hypothetical protein
MKTIITFTFLLFSFLGFSQTTREEVVKRNDYGQRTIVNTYSGTGNSEKLIKKTYYDSFQVNVGMKPNQIENFGTFRRVYTSTGRSEVLWGPIKWEKFDGEGKLISTWKITDDNSSQYTYTLIP